MNKETYQRLYGSKRGECDPFGVYYGSPYVTREAYEAVRTKLYDYQYALRWIALHPRSAPTDIARVALDALGDPHA